MHIKKIISIITIFCMIAAMLTGCNLPEDATLRTLTESSSVEETETEEEPETEESEAETETEPETNSKTEESKPTETETQKPETETPKDTGNSNSGSGNSGNSNSGTTTQPVHTHSYTGKVTKAATCTTAGVKTYTCSCGNSYTESIPATGHSYNSGSVTKAATCTATGVKTYTCTKCGNTKTESIPKVAHTYVDHVATRTVKTWVEGETKTVCLCSCGAQFDNADALGEHALAKLLAGDANHSGVGTKKVTGEGYYVTNTESYVDYQYCSVCGAKK